eukprot:TRINITY_DN4072_c0_g1_i3.p2 TRINITY_DN4072_c0_g1~~TRINITY_DN4072_c0_g1_i3.p2  ORF type:complete len:136 (+),score=13.52 TRINITY_DN4072_c0_g1_i3:155-562(+)
MSKLQQERLSKLSVSDKKLNRLFNNKKVSQKDVIFLNVAYEERLHHNFYYSIVFPGFCSLLSNYLLFRTNRWSFQILYMGISWLTLHMYMTHKIDSRFNTLVNPYFEKYEIKQLAQQSLSLYLCVLFTRSLSRLG